MLWNKKDLSCKIIINASLTESILPYTVGSNTDCDLWLNLEKRFSSTTKSHLFQLKTKIQTLKKGSLLIVEYLQLIKQTADALTVTSSPLAHTDFVAHVLNGLPLNMTHLPSLSGFDLRQSMLKSFKVFS
ncbi:unnamed protein product [Prunus brigantina]